MEEYLNEYCMYCMNELDENGVCKVCGETNADCEIEPHILPTGTVLKGRYLLGAAIGEDVYETGKKIIISEAKILAKFSEEPEIVSIRSFLRKIKQHI